MQVEYHKWWSRNIGHDMEYKIYGHWGKPIIVFPSACKRFWEWEVEGMIETCRPFIDAGKIKIITVDSVDWEAWLNNDAHPADRARRNNDYDRYIVEELIPSLAHQLNYSGKFISTGCSMGAYHAANFFFRHPDIFDTLIALSGVYSTWYFAGDYCDENVYLNNPLAYLNNISDPWFLDQYRQNRIIACVGRGSWEETCINETGALKNILESKGVPAQIEFWGHDVYHDWPWWRHQIYHFLHNINI